MDVELEILELKRRVGDLEGTINVLAGQFGKIHPALTSLGETTGRRFDGVETAMSRIVDRIDMVNTQVWSLRDDMSVLLSDALDRTRKGLS